MRTLALLCALAAASYGQSLMVQAQQAVTRGDLGRAQEMLERAAAEGDDVDRAEAERRLATLAWRFHRNDERARAHFGRAEAVPSRTALTLAALARFETARGRYESARVLARRALAMASAATDRGEARVALAAATVEEAFERGRSAAVAEALDGITEMVRADSGRFVPSRLMYGLALLAGDKTRAGEALRSYHWGASSAPLYPEAALAGGPPEVVAYGRFCRAVRDLAEESFRLKALGRASAWDLEAAVLRAAKRILGIGDKATLLSELSRRYQAEIGFFGWGLSFGHRVVDETRTVEQFGHRARVRYIVLDSMVSNGYITWLTDGLESIGGWYADGDPPGILRVRRDDALLAWMDGVDASRIEQRERRLAKATLDDDVTARKNPYAYLEGLAIRMWARLREDALSAAKAKGASGDGLRLAFLGEFQRLSEGCVLSHETRHMIEGRSTSGFERERNAFLSQVEFAEYPAFCTRGIFAPNIGKKDNGHGEANEQIMKGIVAWMDAHAGQIRGFDRSRPTLPQFDLLTGEQIRAAFRSMDPKPQNRDRNTMHLF